MTIHPLSLAIGLLMPTLALAQGTAPHDQERAKTLDELVVTASPLRSNSENVVQPVEILAGEALDDRRAGTLGETLSSELGVQTSFFGSGVGRPIIRGQEGARVQVLSEGIGSLDASTTSVDHAVSIEPFLADQIEVLKGPATLLYGPGAIGGAVNVVDGRVPSVLPDAPISGRAELRAGTVADERSGMFRLDGAAGRIAWHLDGFRRDTADYEIPGFARHVHDEDEDEDEHEDHEHGEEEEENPFGLLPNSAVDTRGGAVGASYIGERGFIGLAVSRYETLYGVPGHSHHHHEEEEEHAHGDEDEEEGEEEQVRIDLGQTRYNLKGGLIEPFAGVESINLRVGANNYKHFELEGDEIGTRFDNDAVEARADLVHAPIAGWRGALGVQASRRDFSAVGEEAFVPPSLTRDAGLFLIEEQNLDRWKLEWGLRADRVRIEAEGHERRSFSGFSASAGALFRLSDALHFSASFDRAERAPNAEELFSDGPHLATGAFEIGDASLRSETARQLELGAHLHAGPLSGKLSVYRNRLDDFIYLADTGEEEDELPVRVWTQADATFRGLEAELNWSVIENASGAWNLRLSGDGVNAKLNEGGRLPRIVPSRTSVEINWNLGGWRAGVGAQRYERQDEVAEFEEPTDGFSLLNANVAYHWDVGDIGWEAYLRATNLGDREARMHTSVLKEDAPLPGRNLLFGVRVFF
jgi:iron complex outermembrane receptor protein